MSARDKLVAVIEAETGCTRIAARRALGSVLDEIVMATRRDSRLSLPGFGTFRITRRKARKGVNPRTGETMKIPARKSLVFRSSGKFRDL